MDKGVWTEAMRDRARLVRLVALDVDGVLTDGGIVLDDAGREIKRFCVRDGLGVRMLLDLGFAVGVISARKSAATEARGRELGLSFVRQGVQDKWGALREELSRRRLDPTQCAFMGDDLLDLPLMSRVGFSAAPADGDPEVLRRAHWIASRNGGHGAVRELAEGFLKAQGQWEDVVTALINPVPLK
ncbi:MAG: HAD hydrolase family protein [Magnetococcales bacterium]|nr:HAD hydrolase family protein [Magnetococcales bacterium]